MQVLLILRFPFGLAVHSSSLTMLRLATPHMQKCIIKMHLSKTQQMASLLRWSRAGCLCWYQRQLAAERREMMKYEVI